MKFLKIKFHWLFWPMGVYLIGTGNAYTFMAYVFTAVIHEYAHAFAASLFGCRSGEIVLYPYGAVLYGEFSQLKPSEEAVVAAAGPALNLFAALLFWALWWVVPELYAYTDIIATVNLSIGMFNLLPVYPLDGGRIFMAALKVKIGARRAFRAAYYMGIGCCVLFFALYLQSLFFTGINFTFAVLGFVMLASILGNSPDSLTSVLYPPAHSQLSRGMEVRVLRISSLLTPLEVLKLLSTQYYYVLEIVSPEGKILLKVKHEQLESLFTKGITEPIYKLL